MTGEVLQDFRSLITQSKRPTNLLERYWSDLAGAGAMSMISDLVDATRFDQTERFLLPPAASLGTQLVPSLWSLGDNPKKFFSELAKQTGVLTPISNVMKEKQKGRESMLESIQGFLE